MSFKNLHFEIERVQKAAALWPKVVEGGLPGYMIHTKAFSNSKMLEAGVFLNAI